jgi:hypothetical protein
MRDATQPEQPEQPGPIAQKARASQTTETTETTDPAAVRLQHIDPAYRHYPKHVTPQARLDLEDVRLKWYDLARAEAPVPDEIRRLARDFLTAEADAGRLGLDGELGFVVLHRCGEDFYFLIVCTWRGNNEMWESVYFKQNTTTPGFSLFPREHRHKGTLCVWELVPVWHEQQAWVRFLTSPRDAAAQQAYLADRFAGPA